MATQVLVRFRGAPEEVLKSLVKKGYFNTKSEALRAGIIKLGKEYNIVGSAAYYREKLESMLSTKNVSMKQIEKALADLEA